MSKATTTQEPKMTSTAAIQSARAMCRRDGGSLYVVSATSPAFRGSKRFSMDAVAEIDARRFSLELELNGYTDIITEKVR